jgi:excisionase family DNA binding protein
LENLNNDVLTLKEVAVFLKVKPVTIYKLLSLNKIPGTKILGAWRFKKELIEEWMDTDCVDPAKMAM